MNWARFLYFDPMQIGPRDKSELAEQIDRLLNDADNLDSLSCLGPSLYGNPAIRFQLSAERANLLRHLQFAKLNVLEIDSQMGGISRFLAEHAGSLMAVVSVPEEYPVLAERLRDLKNWSAVVSDFPSFRTEKKFDVIVLHGLSATQSSFVRAQEFLTEDGVVIAAVSNPLGLQQWNGIVENPEGLLFEGISGKPNDRFSRKVLKGVFENIGFSKCVEYFPFPDATFPSSVLTPFALQAYPELATDLACHKSAHAEAAFPLFPQLLATENIAKAGLLTDMAPAFLFLCAKNENSLVLSSLIPKEGAFAWHYSTHRKVATQTVFRQHSSGRVTVEKNLYGPPSFQLKSENLLVTWTGGQTQNLESGERLRFRIVRRAYSEGIQSVVQELRDFIRWSFDHWMDGLALDALYTNTLVAPSDGLKPHVYKLFDLEWKLEGEFERNWFILRNVLMLDKDFAVLRREEGFPHLKSLYLSLCENFSLPPDFEKVVQREAEFQSLVNPEVSLEDFRGALLLCLEKPFHPNAYLRDAREESELRSQALTLKEKAPAILSAFDRRLPRLFFKLEDRLRKSKRLRRFFSTLFELVRNSYRLFPTSYRNTAFVLGKDKKSTPPLQRKFGALPKTGWTHASLSLGEGAGTLSDVTLSLKVKGKPQRVLLRKNWMGSFSRILKLSHPVTEISVEIPQTASQTELVKMKTRRLSKMEAAARLIVPQLPHLLWDKDRRSAFLSRLSALWKQGKVRGLVSCIQRQALSGDVGFVEEYTAWIDSYEKLTPRDEVEIRTHVREMHFFPLVSILLPVYNPEPRWLRAALDSVFEQFYPNWELCIADDASTNPVIREIIEEYRAKDPRVHAIFRTRNGHISEASNSALSIAAGEYVTLLDHDDTLSPLALYFVADALNKNRELRFLYSDEDKMDDRGRRFLPHFKTDWNAELFYTYNLITHLAVMETELVKKVGGFRAGFEGSQDYDLFLRYIECIQPEEIHHIPQILYHWRAIDSSTSLEATAKPYAFAASEKALRDHFQRKSIPASVGRGYNDTHQITYALPQTLPKVSVLIGTRDRVDLVHDIVNDLVFRTKYPALEILIIDNQSQDPETLSYFEQFVKEKDRRVLKYDAPFNYAAMNNLGVSEASGDLVLLLNNDIRTIEENWLEEMVRLAVQPQTGAVGAKLFYPSGNIQHAGVILGIGGVAGHSHKGFPQHAVDFYARANVTQWISAVTGACLLVKKSLYESVGGLDAENLTVAFNDIDFCLKLREAGYHNIFTPSAELYHLESESRGSDQRPETFPRFQREEAFMKKKWGKFLKSDPYYNPNLTLASEDFALAFPPRTEKPWRLHEKAKRSTKTVSIQSIIETRI